MASVDRTPPSLLAQKLLMQLNQQLMEDAEPFIKQAVEDFEKRLRTKLGGMLIGMVESRTMIYEREDRLVIELVQAKR